MVDPDEDSPDTAEDDGPLATAVAAPRAKRRTGPSTGGGLPAATPSQPGVAPSIHHEQTQQLPGVGVGSDTQGSGSASSPSALNALRLEEIARTRVFLKLVLVIVVAASAAIGATRGDTTAKLIVYGGIALVVAMTLWLLAVIRNPATFTPGRLMIGGVGTALGSFCGVYYWGVFSPAPALILLGIYFFSFGASQAATRAVFLTCALSQALFSALIMAGVVEDRGLVRAGDLALREQIATQLLVQFLYLCAFVLARQSRRTMLHAVSQLEQAVRAVSQREAQLLEARQDLDRALRVGGPGRYSEQIVGSFRLGTLIGRGGMGEVYEATSVHDGSEAAVKLLHAHVLANPDYQRRFLRETEMAARLDCDNVVRVLEVGSTAGEIPFLAMERLVGHDLAYHLRRRRKLDPGKVVALARQIGAGLEAARRVGIVHRDLKPQNLFLADGRAAVPAQWKILDFGVSKAADRGGTLTRGHVVGTPGYMAPEQARGEDVDWRADLYALAAICYRALTGHPPFTGKDVPSTLYDVVYKMPTQPSTLAELHEDVDLVLAIGMAKAPEQRFASGAALADALALAIRGELSAELRRQARSLLAVQGWGQRR